MTRICNDSDLPRMYEIINDSAAAYKGIIPSDCWKEPYMPMEELLEQIASGVVFWGFEDEGLLSGIMGIQDKGDVQLIRHAYVSTNRRKGGIGTALLQFLSLQSQKPILIGTWKAADWAVSFYRKNGFRLVSDDEKNLLLKRFWNVPSRQIETSVVLADNRWIDISSLPV